MNGLKCSGATSSLLRFMGRMDKLKLPTKEDFSFPFLGGSESGAVISWKLSVKTMLSEKVDVFAGI